MSKTLIFSDHALDMYREQAKQIAKLAKVADSADYSALADADEERAMIEAELAAEFLSLLGVS